MTTNKELVLDHLKTYGSITTWQAITDYGITRLSAAIWTLKHKDNINIKDHFKTVTTRRGYKTNIKVYTLDKE